MNVNTHLAQLAGPTRDGPRSNVLFWDGRVDNRDDLRLALREGLGDDTSNRALVGAAYERWGVGGLRRLIGDWSAVIHDRHTGAIVLATDFAGARPLYYHRQAETIRWSARLGSLVEATGIDAIDEEYVSGFLTLGGSANRTPYVDILAVPPGNAVCVTRTGTTVHQFWALPNADVIRFSDERRYSEQLRALFREAVAVRLQTDAPVIAELSGGLDSSSVVCMANHLIRTGVVAARQLTTVSYVHRDSLDTPFIREVEAFCGIEGVHVSTHRHPLISEAEVGRFTPEGWAPVHASVSMVARGLGANVFLTGQNGDLVMGNWFDDSLQVAAPLRRGRLGQACREALAWSKVLRVPIAGILSRAVQAALPPGLTPSALYSIEGASSSSGSETSLLPAFCRRTGIGDPHRFFSRDWMQAQPERRKHFRALTMMRELRILQPPEPAQNLEYTHPFAHRPLVEFLMSVPADVLCRPGEPRRLMRRALGHLWPPKVQMRRSKSLFGSAWMESLKPLALNLLNTPQWHVVERGWVDRANLALRLKKLTHGLVCNEPQLRQIILLEFWLRNRAAARSEAVLRTG